MVDHEAKNLYHLTTTSPLDRQKLMAAGHETLGDLCALTEQQLGEIVDRRGIMSVKRDLAWFGLALQRHSNIPA